MSAAGNENGGSRGRSVAEVVADWRSRHARGEAVDAEALIAEIEQASGLPPTIVRGQAVSGQAETPTVSMPQPPSARMRAAAAAAARPAGGFGDYEVLREIAHGGMGVVYEARQRSLNRIVALKMIKAGALADEEGVARFYAEAEAAANLRHPNIVAVYEVGHADGDGQHYFTMDYVSGPSLLELVRQQPLDGRKAAELVAKVARAIQFAHERGVLHRDLKPSNILIGEDGEPRVTDFGLAKRIDHDSQLTIAGAIVGTPNYMPPEQARGEHEQVTARSDVYSLGAVLYECLTGRPPLVAARLADILAMVINEEPLPPSRLSPKVPRDLETICLKCLEKEPARRYTTAGELADDLERFLRDEPIRARPVGFVERGLKFARRKPAWAGLGIVSIAAAIVLAVVVAVYTSKLTASNTKLAQSVADEKQQRELAVNRYDSLRRTTYATQIQKTEDYWTDDPPNLAGAEELLASLVPAAGEKDLRGLEWHLLQRLCVGMNRIHAGGRPVAALAARDDGGVLVSSDAMLPAVARYRGREREQLFEQDKMGTADRFYFSKRGPWCAAVCAKNRLELRKIAAPHEPGELIAELNDSEISCAIADDGSAIAYATPGGPVELWRVSDRTAMRIADTAITALRELQVSPDGQWVLQRARDFVIATHPARQVKVTYEATRKGGFSGAAFSPDSSRLALTFADASVDVHVLEKESRRPEKSFNLLKFYIYPSTITFLPDGKRVALGSMNSLVIVVDLELAKPYVYRGHRAGVLHLDASPDGNTLYSGAADGEVLAWDLSVEDQRAEVIRDTAPDGGPMTFDSLRYTPDGRWLVATGRLIGDGQPEEDQGRILLIDPKSRQVVRRIQAAHPVAACSISPDSKFLVYSLVRDLEPQQFLVWNLAADQPAGEVPAIDTPIHSVCFAAGNRLVLGGKDGSLRSIDLDGQGERIWKSNVPPRDEANPRIAELHNSADGRLVFSHNYSHLLRLWDAERGEDVLWSVGHVPPLATALSANGELAAWSTPSPLAAESAALTGIKPSPETQRGELAEHHRAIVFDVQARKIRFVVAGHAARVQALALAADGTRLASGDSAGILKLWDTQTGSELLSMDAHANGVEAIALHPAGRQMASIGSDAALRIWWTE
jgi:serine/threonine protein kinase/WD40 repeat protein